MNNLIFCSFPAPKKPTLVARPDNISPWLYRLSKSSNKLLYYQSTTIYTNLCIIYNSYNEYKYYNTVTHKARKMENQYKEMKFKGP